jgi:hypothetical protein
MRNVNDDHSDPARFRRLFDSQNPQFQITRLSILVLSLRLPPVQAVTPYFHIRLLANVSHWDGRARLKEQPMTAMTRDHGDEGD